MATKTDVRTSSGVQITGLEETFKAISKFGKQVRTEAVVIFRDEAKIVQAQAKANARAHPASPSSGSWIGRSATGKGAGVKLIANKGDYRGFASEFGMHKWQYRDWHGTVWGTVQSAMGRRTFKAWGGNKFSERAASGPGYVIQPAITRHIPGMGKRVADRLNALLKRELDKAGVPRG